MPTSARRSSCCLARIHRLRSNRRLRHRRALSTLLVQALRLRPRAHRRFLLLSASARAWLPLLLPALPLAFSQVARAHWRCSLSAALLVLSRREAASRAANGAQLSLNPQSQANAEAAKFELKTAYFQSFSPDYQLKQTLETQRMRGIQNNAGTEAQLVVTSRFQLHSSVSLPYSLSLTAYKWMASEKCKTVDSPPDF